MSVSPPRCPKKVGAMMEDATLGAAKRGDLSGKVVILRMSERGILS